MYVLLFPNVMGGTLVIPERQTSAAFMQITTEGGSVELSELSQTAVPLLLQKHTWGAAHAVRQGSSTNRVLGIRHPHPDPLIKGDFAVEGSIGVTWKQRGGCVLQLRLSGNKDLVL